jgi:hypothetical protein
MVRQRLMCMFWQVFTVMSLCGGGVSFAVVMVGGEASERVDDFE